ncbi:MAG: N-acetylmuramoyl-L-alanine amidase [Rhizobiaceae bacterium]
MSGFAADHPGADVRVSPNFGPRRGGARPSIILLHYTGMTSGAAAEAWLCNPQSEVSSHYVVHEDGRIVQLVREAERAWHAGQGSWQGNSDVNSASIGIEIVNPGHEFGYPDFPDAQVEGVIALCKGIIARHPVRPEMVLAHSDTAPGRKVDPGEKFPWRRLAEAGVGHHVEAAAGRGGEALGPGSRGRAIEALQSMLALYGYGLEITGIYDERTRAVVEAFQRHFRPERIDGQADDATVETLRALLSALPDPVD